MDRLTLRYLQGFRCIAGSCRENCCTGLRVELTEENHRKLAERSAKIPGLQVLFEKHLELEPEATRTPKRYAHIEPRGPQCPYLDGDWLCAIHRHADESTLADPCSLFPRVITEVNGRRELSATLACPEAARLCLTTDGAVDSVPYEPSMVARELVVRTHDASSTDPYVALLDDVRQVCLDVLFLDGPSATVKLLALLDLALRVQPFFFRGTTTFDAGAMGRAIDEVPGRLQDISDVVAERRGDPAGVRALSELLLARLGGCDNARFNALVRPALLVDPTLERSAIGAYFHGQQHLAKDVSALVSAGREAVEGRFASRLDGYLQRAAVNSLVKDWYTQQPTLASALLRLIVRLALSRFALFLQPGVAADQAALDERAVDSFQIVAKNVEHVPTFMDLAEAYLAEQRLASVEGAAVLLSV